MNIKEKEILFQIEATKNLIKTLYNNIEKLEEELLVERTKIAETIQQTYINAVNSN
jgi:hypothetical protein